jgi:hypothetical protein
MIFILDKTQKTLMIFNIFQKVRMPSYVDLFTFTAPSRSTADANVNTEGEDQKKNLNMNC